MPKVDFHYRQATTVTVNTACEVPASVVSRGYDAVVEYINDRPQLWEDENVTDTEYGAQVTGIRGLNIKGKEL